MRRAASAVAVAVLLGLPVGLPAAHAACTAPELAVAGATPSPSPGLGGHPVPLVRLRAGQPLQVTGVAPAFCDDTGTYGSGCGRPRPPAPARGVDLVLVQGDRRTVLDTADADAQYVVRWDAVLPAGLAPGRAVLLGAGVGLDVEVVP